MRKNTGSNLSCIDCLGTMHGIDLLLNSFLICNSRMRSSESVANYNQCNLQHWDAVVEKCRKSGMLKMWFAIEKCGRREVLQS